MIGSLRGEIAHKSTADIIVDVGGVGFKGARTPGGPGACSCKTFCSSSFINCANSCLVSFN